MCDQMQVYLKHGPKESYTVGIECSLYAGMYMWALNTVVLIVNTWKISIVGGSHTYMHLEICDINEIEMYFISVPTNHDKNIRTTHVL